MKNTFRKDCWWLFSFPHQCIITSFTADTKWVLHKETWSGRNGCLTSLYLLPFLTLWKSSNRWSYTCFQLILRLQHLYQINFDRLHLEPRVSNILQCLVQNIIDPSTGPLCTLQEQIIQSNLGFLSFSQTFQESQDIFLVLYCKLKQRVKA